MIVVGGEALYDLVLQGTAEDLHGHPGGGPFNTARTIGRLEQPVAYLGRLSTDRFGERLEALLAGDGVSLDSVVRTDDPTTLALAEVDHDGVARYRFYERGTSAPGLTPEAALDALPAQVDILHVGTLGLALEPVATALEAVVERLAGERADRRRPELPPVGGRRRRTPTASASTACSGTPTCSRSARRTSSSSSRTGPAVEAVRALLEHGPSVGLLTRGPNGALVVTRTAEVAVPAPRAKVVDTIGAGDAFGGGFLAWWSERGLGREELGQIDLVVEATEFACLVAARTCSRPGASPPWRHEL